MHMWMKRMCIMCDETNAPKCVCTARCFCESGGDSWKTNARVHVRSELKLLGNLYIVYDSIKICIVRPACVTRATLNAQSLQTRDAITSTNPTRAIPHAILANADHICEQHVRNQHVRDADACQHSRKPASRVLSRCRSRAPSRESPARETSKSAKRRRHSRSRAAACVGGVGAEAPR